MYAGNHWLFQPTLFPNLQSNLRMASRIRLLSVQLDIAVHDSHGNLWHLVLEYFDGEKNKDNRRG